MQATLLYYYCLFYLVVTVCCVSFVMLKVHRTLPRKLELLLISARQTMHTGEAVTAAKCKVWRWYSSCWNAVKCNQFKPCKHNQYHCRSCHKFSWNLPQFAQHPLVYGCCTSVLTLTYSSKSCAPGRLSLFLQEGTCSTCSILTFLFVFVC